MSIMDFSGKKILVIGAGISGRAASMALARHGGAVILNDKKAQSVTSIHKCWILRIMCITHDLQSQSFYLHGISPMQIIGHGIAHYGKILMPIHAHQRMRIRFPVYPQAIRPFKLNTAYAYLFSIAIYCFPRVLIFDFDIQLI